MTGSVIVIDFDRDRLVAAGVRVDASGITVDTCVSVDRPAEIPWDNPEAVGAWTGERLRDAGLGGRRVVIALPRGDVVLKRLEMPAGEGFVESDLAGMVRLKMSSQLTMAMEGTAIDYVPLPAGAGGTLEQPAGSAAQVSVMAAALPRDRKAWCEAAAESAKLKVRRIGLRCYGAGDLVAELSHRQDGPVLAVAMGWRSAEFVVVEDGQVVFARGVDGARPNGSEAIDAYAERLAVEAKRTWSSHRMTRTQTELRLVAVLGGGEVARAVALRCAASFECPAECMPMPSQVRFGVEVSEDDREAIAPLVGIIHEEAAGRPYLDLANPRRGPDLGARRRQRVMLGALTAIVLCGVPIVMGKLKAASLDAEIARTQSQVNTQAAEKQAFQIKEARLQHIEKWTAPHFDWLAHLGMLNEQIPSPPQALLDTINGLASVTVTFKPGSVGTSLGTWVALPTASLSISGKVAQRDVAADLRGRLVEGEIYRVESKGPDLPDRFNLELVTAYLTPVKPSPEKPAAKVDGKQEAKKAPASKAASGGGGTKAGADAGGKGAPK